MSGEFDRGRGVTYVGPRAFAGGFAGVCAVLVAIAFGASRLTEPASLVNAPAEPSAVALAVAATTSPFVRRAPMPGYNPVRHSGTVHAKKPAAFQHAVADAVSALPTSRSVPPASPLVRSLSSDSLANDAPAVETSASPFRTQTQSRAVDAQPTPIAAHTQPTPMAGRLPPTPIAVRTQAMSLPAHAQQPRLAAGPPAPARAAIASHTSPAAAIHAAARSLVATMHAVARPSVATMHAVARTSIAAVHAVARPSAVATASTGVLVRVGMALDPPGDAALEPRAAAAGSLMVRASPSPVPSK